MARSRTASDSSPYLGFEAKLWLAADKLRNNMNAAVIRRTAHQFRSRDAQGRAAPNRQQPPTLRVSAPPREPELQALERKPMTMRDWIVKLLDEFLKISGRKLLDHAGKISADDARAKAEREYAKDRALLERRRAPWIWTLRRQRKN